MILISKARYRVLSLLEGCHYRIFRFFMLRSILYSPDVILSFSHSFLFATVTSFFFAPRSGQAAYFSFLREPKGRRDAKAKYHDGTMVRNILRFRAPALDSPLPRSSESSSRMYFLQSR